MKRHPLDLFSLLGGLLFMGLGTTFLLDALNKWSADITWVPPIVLIVLGLAGVLSTVDRQRAHTLDHAGAHAVNEQRAHALDQPDAPVGHDEG
jgi:hypothetical protein